MKIALVTSKIESTGGVQIFTRDLSRILRERGHIVSVIGEESLPPERREDLATTDLETVVGEFFTNLNKEKEFDVVVCNGEMGYAVDHPNAINVFHGSYYGYVKLLRKYMSQEDIDQKGITSKKQKISAEGKHVITVSNFTKEELEEFGINVDGVINNSVDPSLFYPREIDLSDHSLSLGRFQYYRKGFDVLEKLADRGVKIRIFSDAGDAIDNPNIESRPFLDNRLLGKEYSQAQVSIITPRYDAGQLTLLEAMACRCPVLTTPVGYGADIRNVIPEFVVGSVDNIDEFLERHLEIVGNRKKYSKQALDYFRTYHDPKTFKREWIELIEGSKAA
ncbi:MAG: glycosyltransferase family 4 protein [Nanoarchaeota archaeon]|nr:glycosyltransferase family 4 protein [Nanoarchaeota archaeon]